MSENNTNKERKPMYIKVTEPQKFDTLVSMTLETTQRLAKRINKLLSNAFADYYGAVVTCNVGNGNVLPQQMFGVEIHFKPIPAGAVAPNDNRIRAFKPIDEVKDTTDVVSTLKSIYGNLNNSAKYELTSEASEILSKYMLTGANIKPFDPKTYDAYKAEYVNNSYGSNSVAMVKIVGLDLTKLIKDIYGDKDIDGRAVDYGVVPYGPVTPNINNQVVQSTANWRVAISKVVVEKAFDLATEFGLIPASNGSVGPVITAIN